MRKKVFGLEDLKRMNTKTLEYLDQVGQNPSKPKPKTLSSTKNITQNIA